MHPIHALGAGAALAVCGWFLSRNLLPTAATPPVPLQLPTANGHYVLVVEGDRDALAITRAVAKADPWAGVPKGLRSDWQLTIRGGDGAVLATVPLDMSPFAVDAASRGTTRVEGCIVRSGNIGMLVNAPAYATAATYTFTRAGDAGGSVVIGTASGAAVRELAGGGR